MMVTSTCQGLSSVTSTPSLTTTFTPPSWCSTRFFATNSANPPYVYGWHDWQDPRWYSCVPPEWNANACQSLVFSPGICPYGWFAQANDDKGATTCCMSGFSYGSYEGKCMQTSVTDFPLALLATASDGAYESPTASDNGTATMTAGTLDHAFIVIHTAVAQSNRSKLGGGAIAGIVIGAIFFITLIVGLAYYAWAHSRRQNDTNGEEMVPHYGKSELHANELPPTTGKVELSSEGIFEIGTTQPQSDYPPSQQLTSYQPIAELPTDSRRHS